MQNSRVSRINYTQFANGLLLVYKRTTTEKFGQNELLLNNRWSSTGTMMMLYESICGLAEFLDKNFE